MKLNIYKYGTLEQTIALHSHPHSNIYKRCDEHDIGDAIATNTRRNEHDGTEDIRVSNTGTNIRQR